MSLYVFSCVGLEIISNHELASTPEFKAHVDSHFKNLPMTMFTLIRFVCLDDMSEAYVSLVAQDWTLAIYFVTVILVVGIVFMNLLAAAVINSCMEQSSVDRDSLRQDEERRLQRLIHELKRLFHRIDVDGSWQISKAEIKSVALPDKSFLLSAMSTTNLMEVFSRLDVDSSGSVILTNLSMVWKLRCQMHLSTLRGWRRKSTLLLLSLGSMIVTGNTWLRNMRQCCRPGSYQQELSPSTKTWRQ